MPAILSRKDRTFKKVSDIHKHLKDNSGLFSINNEETEERFRNGSLVLVDGFILSKELHALYLEVKKIIPDIKVWSPHTAHRTTSPCGTIVIYRDCDVFAIGAIGYDDYSLSRDYQIQSERKYSVSSRLIEASSKLKYLESIDKKGQMKISKNFKTAVSNAKKYLVPYSGEETHSQISYQTKMKLLKESVDLERNFIKSFGDTLDAIKNEMPFKTICSEVGQQFIDSLGTVVAGLPVGVKTKFLELKDAVEEGRDALGELYKVTLVFRHGEKYKVHAIQGQHPFEGLGFAMDTKNYDSFDYLPEELPEHLQGKLNLLMMIDSNQIVRGVGYREGTNYFCVVDGVSQND